MKNTECNCGGEYAKTKKITEEGLEYETYQCNKCGDSVLDMIQAEALFKSYEKMHSTTVSKWGEALAIRIPSAVVRELHLKPRQKARIISEKKSFRVVPA